MRHPTDASSLHRLSTERLANSTRLPSPSDSVRRRSHSGRTLWLALTLSGPLKTLSHPSAGASIPPGARHSDGARSGSLVTAMIDRERAFWLPEYLEIGRDSSLGGCRTANE